MTGFDWHRREAPVIAVLDPRVGVRQAPGDGCGTRGERGEAARPATAGGQAAAAAGASTGCTARRPICTRFQTLIEPISKDSQAISGSLNWLASSA